MSNKSSDNKSFWESLPEDVLWATLKMSSDQSMGSDTYNRILSTIKAYPEYFPWEHKYNEIDDSIHDAYKAAKEELYYEIYPERKINPSSVGKGWRYIVEEQISRSEPTVIKPFNSEKEALKAVNDSFKRIQESLKKEKLYKTRLKALWGKHYSQYKLEFRDKS